MWTGNKKLDELRSKAAAEPSGVIKVSIEELNQILPIIESNSGGNAGYASPPSQGVQNGGNYVPNLDNITEVKTILIGNHKWKIAGDVTVPKDEIWAVNADGTKQIFKI